MRLKLIEEAGPDGAPALRIRGRGQGLGRRERVSIILELLARSPHLTARELADLMGSRETTIRGDMEVVEEMRRAWREMTARAGAEPSPLRARNVSWDSSRRNWRLKAVRRNGSRVV